MFRQKRKLLLIVAFTLILNGFLTSFNYVIAAQIEETEREVVEEIQKALEWIRSEQEENGFWDEKGYGGVHQLYTTKIIEIITRYNYLPQNHEKGIKALKSMGPTNNDYLARYLSLEGLKKHYDIQELINSQNRDGGWGILTEYTSNVVDTMLVVKALSNSEHYNNEVMNKGIRYLINKQNHNGSWSYTETSNPSISLTAEITLILSEFIEKIKITSNELETSILQGGEYLVSKKESSEAWNIDEDNINETLLSYKAVLNIFGESYVDGVYENIKNIQNDNGSWYEDSYTTILAIDALKTKGNQNLTSKINNIKTSIYNEDQKIETDIFDAYENILFEVEGEYSEEEVEISILIKSPDGKIEKAEKQIDYIWNTGKNPSGTYTVIGLLKDRSNGRIINSLEKNINIKDYFNISNIILKIEPKGVRINTDAEVSIIGSLINKSNIDKDVEVKIEVINENKESIIERIYTQNCKQNQQTINIPTTKFIPNTEDISTYLIKATVYSQGQILTQTQREFKVLLSLPPVKIDVVRQLNKEILYPGED